MSSPGSRAKALAVARRLFGPRAFVRGEERTTLFHVEAWRSRQVGPDELLHAADGALAPAAWDLLIERLHALHASGFR